MKLSVKLSAIVILLVSFAIGWSGFIIYSTISTSLQRQISTNQHEITRQTMDKIDRHLNERRIDITILAQREQIRDFLLRRTPTTTDTNNTVRTLTNYKQLTGTWSNLNVLDLQGAARIATETSDTNRNILNSQLGGLYEQAKLGQTVVSDVVKLDHRAEPSMIIMAPVRDTDNRVIGVISGEISWAPIADILGSIKGPAAYLTTKDGKIIARNHTNDAHNTLGSKYKAPAEDVVTTQVSEPGFQDYKGNEWELILSTTTNTAYAPARELAFNLLLMFLGIAILSVGTLFLLLNRHILKPLRGLSDAVTRVALGDLSQTLKVQSKDEIGMLSQNFNEMIRQLATTHRSLEATSQKTREERAKLEASINGLRQGFILTDTNGETVMANSSARQMLNASHRKIDASLPLDGIAKLFPKDLELSKKVQQTLKQRKLFKLPDLALGGRFLNLYLSPVSNEDSTIGCVLLFEDITEERIIQRSRDEFFSIASHELRTPLTAIRGNTSLIQQYYPEPLKDDSLREMIGDIHESAVRLIEIVNDFLDASRLEQNKMKFSFEAFSVENIIEKVIYEMAGISQDKGLTLSFDQNTLGKIPMVYADQNRIKQIIYNLVGNAMKFTEKGGVTINCLVEDKQLKVCVSDTGPGISAEGQQILFHKFQQATTSTLTRDNTRGTGLGLYISKLLLEHMGGHVQLEHSEVGKGTTFSFTLPIADAEQIAWAEAKRIQLKNTLETAGTALASTAAPAATVQAPTPKIAASTPTTIPVTKKKTTRKSSSQLKKDV